MAAAWGRQRLRLSNRDKQILRIALSRHHNRLKRAAAKCMGITWHAIYTGEANDTEFLLKKLLGAKETILED